MTRAKNELVKDDMINIRAALKSINRPRLSTNMLKVKSIVNTFYMYHIQEKH